MFVFSVVFIFLVLSVASAVVHAGPTTKPSNAVVVDSNAFMDRLSTNGTTQSLRRDPPFFGLNLTEEGFLFIYLFTYYFL